MPSARWPPFRSRPARPGLATADPDLAARPARPPIAGDDLDAVADHRRRHRRPGPDRRSRPCSGPTWPRLVPTGGGLDLARARRRLDGPDRGVHDVGPQVPGPAPGGGARRGPGQPAPAGAERTCATRSTGWPASPGGRPGARLLPAAARRERASQSATARLAEPRRVARHRRHVRRVRDDRRRRRARSRCASRGPLPARSLHPGAAGAREYPDPLHRPARHLSRRRQPVPPHFPTAATLYREMFRRHSPARPSTGCWNRSTR